MAQVEPDDGKPSRGTCKEWLVAKLLGHRNRRS